MSEGRLSSSRLADIALRAEAAAVDVESLLRSGSFLPGTMDPLFAALKQLEEVRDVHLREMGGTLLREGPLGGGGALGRVRDAG